MQVNRANLPERAYKHPLFFKAIPVSEDVVDLRPLDFAQCKDNILRQYTLSGALTSSPVIDLIKNSYTWDDLSAATGYSTPDLRSPEPLFVPKFRYLELSVSNGHYVVEGNDRTGSISGNEPDIKVFVGDIINIIVEATGHPVYLKTSPGTGTDNQIPNVTGQGAENHMIEWQPTDVGVYYYQCSNHENMVGTITVSEYLNLNVPQGNYAGPGGSAGY